MIDRAINKLKKLYQLGQSPWYDNIDRRLIESGELKSLFDSGIMGVTSNPTIFEKAINSSTVYNEKISRLKAKGRSVEEIYDELTADDVRDAADMLKSIYEQTKGIDGYVSIEVLPSYAHDPDKTIEHARHIFRKVKRKNILIKVPGTKESPEAIRTLIREGINVNVTLLFSISQYEPIAFAYQEGLRDRVRLGFDIKSVISVASVFVSRIDTKIDHILDVFAGRENDLEKRTRFYSLKGKIAIANAKFIYQRFKEIFSDKAFGDLKLMGGNIQKVIWASTSTKNPIYDDLLYVNNLIGPFTINTMPHQTVLAFVDHGHAALTLENKLEEARRELLQLEDIEINLEKMCQEAQVEGVEAFERSFQTVMNSLKAKMA